ncbi:MAG: hypothetical protein LBI10_12030, partial [Deltaproteobacteria bacterium]|nr:hypothetical protein [Deltaproteobacteria bacterium]
MIVSINLRSQLPSGYHSALGKRISAILILDFSFYSSYGVAWKGDQLLGKKFLNHGFPSTIFG